MATGLSCDLTPLLALQFFYWSQAEAFWGRDNIGEGCIKSQQWKPCLPMVMDHLTSTPWNLFH